MNITRRAANGAVLLDGASLRIEPGQRWALFGPSGSGKTLLLRALALLDPIDGGEVRWHDEAIPSARVPAYRRRMVYLHQRPALVEGTVEHNLRLAFDFQSARAGSKFSEENCRRYLAAAHFDPSFLNRRVAKLSGGERQMAALLRALLVEPEVLLLDEPTAALDARRVGLVEDLVRQYLSESETRSSVWVTHHVEQLPRIADWQLPIHAGRTEEPRRVG